MSRNRSKYLGNEILNAANKKGINLATTSFKPSDLDIKSSTYGSFADWCSENETTSGKYNIHVCLTVAQRRNGKPFKYYLLPQDQWV